jgi:hypothetical protein
MYVCIYIYIYIYLDESRSSLLGIVAGYRLDYRGSGVRFLAGAGNVSLLHRVQTGSGPHPASCPMVPGAVPSVVEWPRSEADHSPPSSAKVKNAWSCTSNPNTPSWRGA